MVGFFRVRAFFTVAALLGGVASRALAAGPPPAAPLPLTRVRLYETGVGYFERTGPLSGRAVTLPVPAGHLDDALKTLVVLSDDADARIGGVEFSSSVSPSRARALAGLPGEGIPLGLSTLLKSLKGVSVEVSAPGGRVTGTLVEVLEAEQSDLEDCARNDAGPGEKAAPCAPKKQPTLVLLGATGEIRRLRIDDVESVRPLEPAFAPRLAAALDALSDRGARVLKELRVSAQGKKGITLGYVAETPVWRATYRLVLPPDQSKAQIQGWALLHNDTDEAWHRVRVELVNGRPDSFLFPLAAPRYARRTLVTPDEPLSTLPQLAGTTPDALWTGDEYEYGAGGLGLSGVGEGGGGSGEGIGLGSVGTLGHGAGTAGGDGESSLLSVGNLAGIAQATGVEAGALFRFALSEPVELRPHGSVLAPFLGEPIEARRIALFSEPGARARSAVRLTHVGSQTLPAGTIAVFGDGGFLGESVLQRMKPEESQIVEFGSDLDVELGLDEDKVRDETRLLSFDRGDLVEHYLRHHALVYRIENRSGSGRAVSVGLDFVNNAKVEGAESLVYDVRSSRALAGFSVAAHETTRRELSVSEGLVRRHAAGNVGVPALERLASLAGVPAKQRKVVEEALGFARESRARRAQRDAQKAALAELSAELERLRGHARAVGAGNSEAIVERLLAVEDRAKLVRRQIAVLGAQASERAARVPATLARLPRVAL